ncbi:neutrophil gelatinase-associated lipocalin isoform X3 [Mirounga angustirostris]|uniref:neutrophil gelatinase-associated lipocalin-like n=1 Tax=Mirounga leonina TaxID=9715 RepID=UPI00156C09F0|nr:neutrophil gelatinase-associated lipocalin-like [Mirounga leonina]XP_034861500.1 neutrophil gelatinase-associated lipocalin-like isoform X1 [Mirounga leonina]XP_045737975.1 neutrophil gelatinase-associated lipocalin isoform X2 [Mirounga angustirostris]
MARGLLWLGLVLLGALQAQAQDSPPELIPAPFLTKIPLQPDFQDDQFQGKWYVIGVAGNSINTEKRAQLKMYTTTYQLKDNRSYNVTSTLIRNQRCDHWIRTFVPSSLPGQFTLGNIKRYVGVQSYTVQVMTTNYNQFAMVFFKKVYKNQEYFKITLYGRTKQLPTALKEYFTGFAKSLGLTDDHIIFPVPTDQCIDDK